MSRAFVKEGDGPERTAWPDIALPPGVPNRITPAGRDGFVARRDALRAERDGLDDTGLGAARRHAIDDELRFVDARLASFVVTAPPDRPVRVGFGCEVELDGDPPRTWRLVGVDEADPASGRISWQAPVARALLGACVDDEVLLRTPAGEETVVVTAIRR